MATTATDATNGTAPESKAPAPKTVAEDMANRRVFPNPAEAAAYLTASAETFTDFGSTVLAAPGIDSEGNFDPEVYSDSMDVMVSILRKGSKVKSIVVAPCPKISVLLESDAGRAWVDKILHKEMNHVAVRALREADDVSTVIDQMPTTIEAYIEPGRGDGGIIETFNELYKQINATLSAKLPVWSKARLIKSELRKAMESAGYASEYYPALEDYKGESLFVAAAKLGINAAKRKGLDPTIFERWLSTRDQKAFTPGQSEDDDFDVSDIDSLTDSLLAEDKPDAAPTAEPEAPVQPEEAPAAQ